FVNLENTFKAAEEDSRSSQQPAEKILRELKRLCKKQKIFSNNALRTLRLCGVNFTAKAQRTQRFLPIIMKLQTEIPLKPEKNQLDYSSKILLLGSCFSENIGAKFDYFKFQNLQNPFGVIFNPVSIEKLVVRAIENKTFSEKDVFQHNGIWKCLDAHSELVALDKNEFLHNLNTALQNLREALFTSTHIIFTFGTSWVYRSIGASA